MNVRKVSWELPDFDIRVKDSSLICQITLLFTQLLSQVEYQNILEITHWKERWVVKLFCFGFGYNDNEQNQDSDSPFIQPNFHSRWLYLHTVSH